VRTLVIESSTDACSAALFDGTDLIDGQYELLGRGHAERLVPMISELPGKGKAHRIAASLGPGSFTGTRIGIAVAQALAFAWGARCVGYPTLALVAAMARSSVGDQPVAVAMTGGHGEWFVEGFAPGGASAWPLASLGPQQAANRATETIVAGTQATQLVLLRESGKALDLLPDARSFSLLPEAALTSELSPIYGRAPDARRPAS